MARALRFPGGGGGWAPDLDSDYGVALHACHRSFASIIAPPPIAVAVAVAVAPPLLSFFLLLL